MIKKLTLLLVLCFLPVFAATAQDSQNALEIDEHITGLDIEQHFKQIEDL